MNPGLPFKPSESVEPTVSARELDQSLNSAPDLQAVAKSKKTRLVIILVSLLVATVSGVFAFKILRDSPQPDVTPLRTDNAVSQAAEIVDPIEVAKRFIKGLQTGDKQQVDSLLGPNLKAAVKADTGSESYYWMQGSSRLP